MKTKEELNALKEEVEALNVKLAELTEEELEAVSGGAKRSHEEFLRPCNEGKITGSTKNEMKIDVDSNCHSFYTGKQKLVERENRVEKMQKRLGL